MLDTSDSVDISGIVAIQAADYEDTVKQPDGFGARRLSSGRFGAVTGRELIRCHRAEEIVHRAEHQRVVAGDDTDSPAADFHKDYPTHAGCGYRVVEIKYDLQHADRKLRPRHADQGSRNLSYWPGQTR